MEKILIDATGGKGWVGGVYYKNNILYSLTENKQIMDNYKILVVTNEEFVDVFEYTHENIELKCIKYKNRREKQLKILILSIVKNCKYIYHGSEEFYSYFGKTLIRWIPDFQHNYFPENFSKNEVEGRNNEFQRIAKEKNPIVLSSHDAYKTYIEKYDIEPEHVFVVPFVSYIAPVLRKITNNDEDDCMKKFSLRKKNYICVMNQFWKHKNHIVVLNALKDLYKDSYNDGFVYVFTGELKDYRNPEYINQIKKLLNNLDIKNRVRILGFIDRKEQLILMKNAAYIIQPSLFEGWGTVVEDAKVLDKTILLSDIPVHREQKNEKCILFDPYDSEKLAGIIKSENMKEHIDDIENGLYDMAERAKEYSLGFQKLLGC